MIFRVCVILVGLLYYTLCSTNAQGTVKISSDSTFNAVFSIYNPYYEAGMIYADTVEAHNTTRESTMSSILSASNQMWVDYNTDGGSSKSEKKSDSDFVKIKNRNREASYFQLQARLDLVYNGEDVSLIKFYLYLEEFRLPAAGVLLLKKMEGRWYETSIPDLTPLSSMMLVFRTDVLDRLLHGKFSNDSEEELIKLFYVGGSLDIKGLLSRKYSEEEKAVLTNPLNW